MERFSLQVIEFNDNSDTTNVLLTPLLITLNNDKF